tara:strand:+ start:14460 stop:15134 length:675 start_codon:yes stop_codon:yes gene_type:complete
MARLFITNREINFINDIGKEIVKDVIGQKVYYFPISHIKSKVHDIYEEAPEKVFENPINLDAVVQYQPQEIRANQFGFEEFFTIEVYVQKRDLLDKQIDVQEGDFFSYGTVFFEVIQAPDTSTIYGQIEHLGFTTLIGRQARKGLFVAKVFGPYGEDFSDPQAVQETFVQQRGFTENQEGITGDVRSMRQNGTLSPPITGPKQVSPKGASTQLGHGKSAFYDEC